MREVRQTDVDTALIEKRNPSDLHYHSLVPVDLIQEEWRLTLKVAPIGSEPRIFVQPTNLPEPQPLLVDYSHIDSDDDMWAVDAYDITKVTGFFIDPESEEPVYVLSCQNDGSTPRVKPGFTFYRLGDDSNLIPINIFEQQTPCRSINLEPMEA